MVSVQSAEPTMPGSRAKLFPDNAIVASKTKIPSTSTLSTETNVNHALSFSVVAKNATPPISQAIYIMLK
jgi:hypothetical protein